MPQKRYLVNLTPVEEKLLRDMTRTGNGASAREILHARILLKSNDAQPDRKRTSAAIAKWLEISPTTVNTVRKAYATGGLDAAPHRKTRVTPPMAARITGDVEAKIIATALGPAPEGCSRWTPRLLAEHRVEKGHVVSISHTSVGDLPNTNQPGRI